MWAHTAGTAFWIALTVVVLLAMMLAMLPILYRYVALKHASQHANERANQRIQETDDVTDQLLQGVQGLLLTFHVAAQKMGEDHISRKLMDHALSEADHLVSAGRRRFEQVAFHSETEARDHDFQSPAKNSYRSPPEGRDDRL